MNQQAPFLLVETEAEMEKFDLLIKNADIYTMDAYGTVIKNGVIGIQGDTISLISQMDTLDPCDAEKVIDAKGSVIFPGFINTHIHIFQSFLKGLGADHQADRMA